MTDTTWVLLIAFIGLIVLGVPIAFSMFGASALAILVQGDFPWNLLVMRTLGGVDSFVLLAIPLFILAGMIMEHAGISARLMTLAQQLVGKIPGGLPISVVLATMLESGLSGSTVGDVSAMMSIAHPGMVQSGYERAYSLSVIAAAAAFGILVPPSIIMVVLGSIAQVPVTTLFVAALIPACVLGLFVMALIFIQAKAGALGRVDDSGPRRGQSEVVKAVVDSLWAMGVPIIIFGGIFLGIATATEIAAFAVLYSLFVGILVYRTIRLRTFIKLIGDTAVATGTVTMILGLAAIFSFILATEGVPAAIADAILGSNMPPWAFMIISALVFVFIGSAVDGIASLLIFVPVFLPVAVQLDINLVHYLTITTLASGIGLLLPPAGMGMVMACGIGRVRMERVFRPFTPFLAVMLAGVLVLILFPEITLIAPRLLDMVGV